MPSKIKDLIIKVEDNVIYVDFKKNRKRLEKQSITLSQQKQQVKESIKIDHQNKKIYLG